MTWSNLSGPYRGSFHLNQWRHATKSGSRTTVELDEACFSPSLLLTRPMGDGKRTTIPRRHHMASLRLIVGGRRAKEILPRYKDILNCPLRLQPQGRMAEPRPQMSVLFRFYSSSRGHLGFQLSLIWPPCCGAVAHIWRSTARCRRHALPSHLHHSSVLGRYIVDRPARASCLFLSFLPPG